MTFIFLSVFTPLVKLRLSVFNKELLTYLLTSLTKISCGQTRNSKRSKHAYRHVGIITQKLQIALMQNFVNVFVYHQTTFMVVAVQHTQKCKSNMSDDGHLENSSNHNNSATHSPTLLWSNFVRRCIVGPWKQPCHQQWNRKQKSTVSGGHFGFGFHWMSRFTMYTHDVSKKFPSL